MASDAQINANRRNAQKSTGPRTPEGKAISSRNSMVHGLTSQSPQLPGEDSADLTALRDEYIEHYEPVGPIEADLVERIAIAHYRLKRAARLEITYLDVLMRGQYFARVRPDLTNFDRVAWAWFGDKNGFARLGAYEARLQREISRCIADLKQMRALRPKNNGEESTNTGRTKDEHTRRRSSADPAEKTNPRLPLSSASTTNSPIPANPIAIPKPSTSAPEAVPQRKKGE
jgi:hypothetical protein